MNYQIQQQMSGCHSTNYSTINTIWKSDEGWERIKINLFLNHHKLYEYYQRPKYKIHTVFNTLKVSKSVITSHVITCC